MTYPHKRRSSVRSFVLAILVVIAAFAATTLPPGSGVARASADAQATLTVRSSRYGSILFDGRGRALYAFTRDRRGGASRCYGACAKKWPVYFSGGGAPPGQGGEKRP